MLQLASSAFVASLKAGLTLLPPRGGVCLVPSAPADEGSLGDDAMLLGFLDALTGESVSVLSNSPGAVPQGSISRLSGALRPHGALAVARSRASRLIVNGADVIDGRYDPVLAETLIRTAGAFASRGRRAEIVNFSWSTSPTRRSVEAFRALPDDVTVQLRDPHSAARFRADTGHSAPWKPDVAFLLRPADSAPTKELLDWCRLAPTLGVVVNAHRLDERPSGFVDTLAGMLAKTLPADAHALCLGHDSRGTPNDFDVADALAAALAAHGRRARAAGRLSAAETKSVAGGLIGLLTGRFHAAIGALGRGVPVFVLSYADKDAGVLEQFELGNRTIPSEAVQTTPDEVRAALSRWFRELPLDRGRIARHLPAVMDAARSGVS